MQTEKSTLKKSFYAILSLVIVYSFLGMNGFTARAEGENEPIDVGIMNPYIFHYMVEDQNNEDFKASGDNVTFDPLDPERITSGIIVEGKQNNINNAEIVYKEKFEFSSGVTNKVRIDGLAKRGSKISVEFYLDDETEPFVSTPLPIQSDADNWTASAYKFVEINNPAVTGSHVLKIKFRVDKVADDKKTQALLRSFKFYREGVPTVYINIDESLGTIEDMNNSENHTANCYGDMCVRIPKGYESYYEDKTYTEDTVTDTCEFEYIRGRGNSTWWAPKKPYKIKLKDSYDFFGMGANKHWALIANYYDGTLLRNRMTYFLGNAMGMEYTPQLVPVDVMMNGTYLGSYYLSEVVRIDPDRVDLRNLEKIDEADDDITGGYLLGMSPYGTEDGYIFDTPKGVSFVVESPEEVKKDDGTKLEAMNEYIEDYINKVENAIFSENFTDEYGKSYKDYLDLESAAKYFLVQSFSQNGDAYGTASTKLYKKPGKDGKLYFGPLWDFDYVAWNYTGEGEPIDSFDPEIGDEENFDDRAKGFDMSFAWFDRLLEDPDFIKAVNDAWFGKDEEDTTAMRDQILKIVEDGGILDQYLAQLIDSAESNYDIPGNNEWGLGIPAIDNGSQDDDFFFDDGYGDFEGFTEEEDIYIEEIIKYSNAIDYENEIKKQKKWINQRMAWVDENIKNIDTAPHSYTFAVKFYDGEELIYSEDVFLYDNINQIPEPPKKEGYIFGGWWGEFRADVPEEEPDSVVYAKFTQFTVVVSDITLEAKWIPEDEVVKTEDIYIGTPEVYIGVSEYFTLNYSIYPAEAAELGIDFISSDNNIVSVDEYGNVFARYSEGESTITIRTFDGKEATCKVHVVEDEDVIYPEDIELSETSVTMKEGEMKAIHFSFLPEGSVFRPYKVISTDDDIAEMTDSGMLTAKKAGTTAVLIYLEDLNLYKKIKVTVEASEEPAADPVDLDMLNVKKLKKGNRFTSGKLIYEITEECKMVNGKVVSGTVSVVGIKKSVKKKTTSVVIPALINSKNNSFKVTGIKAKAFKGCKKLKKITIKTKTLKVVGKNAFKGINKKAKIKVPASKLKAYKKLLKKKGQKKTVKISK